MSRRVRRLPRSAVDAAAWDAAVGSDDRPLPYGLSWWLDAVTGGRWDGLVLEDYRAVLPLPYRTKVLGRPWVMPPPFTQQQGPFGRCSPAEHRQLLDAVPGWFGRAALHLRSMTGQERINQVLRTDRPYPDLLAGYSRSLRKRLRRAAPARLSPCPIPEVTALYRQQLGEKAGLADHHYGLIERLATACQERQLGDCWQLTDDGGRLAAGFFPRYAGRTVNLFAAATPYGDREMGMARLLDVLIRAGAGRDSWFDFEGSNLPGVYAFFRSFGATEDNYRRLTF